MLKITTESGAVYLDDDMRVMRLSGPYSPGIDYTVVPDSEWHTVNAPVNWELGISAYISFVNGKFRTTTPVVSIEAA